MMREFQTEDVLKIDSWLNLPEASLELAEALENLAPYGSGNEKLTLATHGLKIQSKTPIGRNQEHLKLNVSDEAGNTAACYGGTVRWKKTRSRKAYLTWPTTCAPPTGAANPRFRWNGWIFAAWPGSRSR